MLLQASSIGMAIAGMTSVAGRCHTFDSRADGFCRGEGCSAVVVRSGDDRLVVMRGSAVRQDGRSASLTAPNGVAQQTLLLIAFGVTAPAEVAFLETHGTGTPLGDPIEAGALARVFSAEARDAPLPVGAAKANVGHTEAPAGQMGLMRALDLQRDATAAPSAKLDVMNPMVAQARSRAATSPVTPPHR